MHPLQAQQTQLDAAEIKLGLQKLNVVGNVLYIAAHPDDENTRLLAFLAKEKKLRTGYLSLTRGDGGQNLLGTEQSELLGLIRTQELIAARKIDGAEQFFSRAIDFGFSKTSAESLKIWGVNETLEDIVAIIRKFKPDVIITRFPEDARAGHGQHAASAILAKKAFFAAADGTQFTSQLDSLEVWQAKRLVWNTFNFGGGSNTETNQLLSLNVGEYNPLVGKSYGEISAQSRTNHKSQGFGTASQRGEFIEYFDHIAGEKAHVDLFNGINNNWNKFPESRDLSDLIKKTIENFDALKPSQSINALLEIKKLIERTGNKQKTSEVDDLIIACAGVWLDINSLEPQYATEEQIPVVIRAIARVPSDFNIKIILNESQTNQSKHELPPNKYVTIKTVFPSPKIGTTQPYWLESEHTMGSFTIANTGLIGLPEDKTLISANFQIQIGDQFITRQIPINYVHTDPVRGEIYEPLVIAPPVTASFAENSYLFTANATKKISVQLTSFRDNITGKVQINLPKGWSSSPAEIDFQIEKKGEVNTQQLTISPPQQTGAGKMSLQVKLNGKVYDKAFKQIRYDHIPTQTVFPKSEVRLENIQLRTKGLKIAYIPGAGDLVSESLKQVGYDVTTLSPDQILNTDLSVFDAVITGVRLYNVEAQMKVVNPKLMEYVKNGGTLLVQYNVNNLLQTQQIGPFPLMITRDRVTEEDSEVRILIPEHPVFNFPNKIRQEDFNGWIQERGLYFAKSTDNSFKPLLSMNDVNEKPLNGALLVGTFGKGRYVYTSLSFFRQLPAGVPGAYKLFVNLISK